jgi:putative DNA methylase
MDEKRISDVRLIERWLPIGALSEESVRERRSMTALPPIYYLHVWWARRPLIAARAAVLASLLPADADREKFMQILGIHGDPVESRRRIDRAKRSGVRFEGEAYSYDRAFSYCASESERDWLRKEVGSEQITVVDPTAGGGSIPFEARRLGLEAYANDLNPVAAAILTATVDLPFRFGASLIQEFQTVASEFVKRRESLLRSYFPAEPEPNAIPTNFLWAHTITCPYCSGKVPLSPNWRLSPDGRGIRLVPKCEGGPGSRGRVCSFEIVAQETEQSQGTVSDGDATCCFPDCKRVIAGSDVKRQAQAGEMGEQLFTIVFKRRVETRTKSGKRGKAKWERGYRTPRPEDDISDAITTALNEKIAEWDALDQLPSELLPMDTESWTHGNTPAQYGARTWRDLFAPRQLLGHGFSVQVFQEMVEEDRRSQRLTELKGAAYLYLCLSIDSTLNYVNRSCRWDPVTERVRSIFDRHDFAFCWSYAEMAVMIEGIGYDWIIEKTGKCIEELVELANSAMPEANTLFEKRRNEPSSPPATITCKPGDSLNHIADQSVHAVIMDPPYGANVMYAELSDFFYVWLKRTAALVKPELFTRNLTDKDSEAVVNVARFNRAKGAAALANRDYRERMQSIFTECRRVLKPNGLMTVMFTHKGTGAWDALTTGLIEAGFFITASWPVRTEAEDSMHIKKKAAAKSTIVLVCRPRSSEQSHGIAYWEDVEPLVAKAVRTRVAEFQKAGISGVDLYLASFGPALEEFSRHWPLKRGTPRTEPLAKKRRKQAELFEEEFDPYAVTPEDALDAARREVKIWRLNQLTHTKGRGDLDAITSWFVLAWDAFKAPVFSYDEGLRLARAVGADLDGQLIGKICEKQDSDIKLWDSATRAAKNALGPADGSRAMIDAIHHAAHRGRTRTLDAALDLLKDVGIDSDPQFLAALEAVLEVLPPSRNFVGFDVATGDAKAAADDFDALEKLRRLAFSDKVDEPQQLSLFAEEAA